MLSFYHPQPQHSNSFVDVEENGTITRATADHNVASADIYELEPLNSPVPFTHVSTSDNLLAPDSETPSSQHEERENLSSKAGGHLPTRSFDTSKLRHNKLQAWLVSIAALLLVAGPTLAFAFSLFYGTDGPDELSGTLVKWASFCDYADISLSQITLLDWFFRIDIVIGKMPFGLAKFIDVAFDIVVGRGGQAVLSYITYRVIGASVNYIMESDPVTYELFACSSMASITTFSFGPLLKFVFRRPRSTCKIKHRILMVWLALSVLWVGFYPTMLSAMTGYTAFTYTGVLLENANQTMDFHDFLNSNITFALWNASMSDAVPIPTFNTFSASGPNVSLWQELWVHWDESAVSSYQNQTYVTCLAVGDFSYPISYTNYFQNVLCINRYSWGISIALAIITVILNGLWTIGTYGVWMHMVRKSEFHRKRRQVGKYKAAIDIAEAISNELGQHACGYSEEEIEAELKKRLPIRYHVREDEENGYAHIGLSSDDPKGKRVKLEFGKLYGGSK
ncbi:hypothetical protein LPUS_03910 [Lasallia pustulata]|uniref:Uncharacterized protein n=1 Tax=Lasallia pustulata TaxID=136370 RepID=A0A1W5CW39_9LECA|nr:hypothetical protein LPUS_03910 [Lasallia pustulata]